MKKEAAADEEGVMELDAPVMGVGRSICTGPLRRQGVKVLLLVVLLRLVTVVSGAAEVGTSLPASPFKLWACWHIDTEQRPQSAPPSAPFAPSSAELLLQMGGQMLQPESLSWCQQP